jgi:transposase
LVPRKGKQRLDSTHVLGLVSAMSKLESIRETVRLALIELADQLPESERPAFWPLLWERYVEHKLDYRSTDTVFKEKHQQAGGDAQQLLGWLEPLPVTIRDGRQVRLLREVFGQYYVVSEQVVAPVKVHAAGVVQNPHDPEATWCTKGKSGAKKEWTGYKIQVAESVGPARTAKTQPTGNFLTSVVTQAATESDAAGMKATLEAQAQMGLDKPTELLVDAGYVSAAAIVEAQSEGRELVGPARPSPRAESGSSSEDFDLCVEERRATCPAGHQNTQCSRLEEKATGKVSYRFEWSTHCADCALREKCIGKGQAHRTLVVGEHHTALQGRRNEQKTEEFGRRMKERNAIEGTHSEMVRGHGQRQARYRGKAKLDLQNQLIGAACNIKRWLKLAAWELRVAAAAAASMLGAQTASAS